MLVTLRKKGVSVLTVFFVWNIAHRLSCGKEIPDQAQKNVGDVKFYNCLCPGGQFNSYCIPVLLWFFPLRGIFTASIVRKITTSIEKVAPNQ